MTRTGQAAIDYAYSRVGENTMPDSGLCLQFTRQCFDVPSYYYSAIDAWNANPEQHAGDRYPPPAVPVWFWSSSPYRHVAFHVGNGTVITTYNDDVRVYSSIAAMEGVFGGYMGWSPSINRVTIYDTTPEPSPEEDMTPAESNMLFHIGALLEQTPFRSAEAVHSWQISRVAGAPTTFLQDQTDGVTNTYTLVTDAAAGTQRRWSPLQVLLVLLAVAVVVLVLLAPLILQTDADELAYLGVVGVLATAVATLVASGVYRQHRPPASTPHVDTHPPADPSEPIDPDNDPARDLRIRPQDLERRPE